MKRGKGRGTHDGGDETSIMIIIRFERAAFLQ
jgi:hypothetical protein